MTKRVLSKLGRPKRPIDWAEFDGLCKLQCTATEIATWFHCSVDTIERRLREEKGQTFAEYFSKKRISGVLSLRRNLFKLSEKNAAVAIFMAKNLLGMRDVQEHTGRDGGPIEHREVYDFSEFTDAELKAAVAEAERHLDETRRR